MRRDRYRIHASMYRVPPPRPNPSLLPSPPSSPVNVSFAESRRNLDDGIVNVMKRGKEIRAASSPPARYRRDERPDCHIRAPRCTRRAARVRRTVLAITNMVPQGRRNIENARSDLNIARSIVEESIEPRLSTSFYRGSCDKIFFQCFLPL